MNTPPSGKPIIEEPVLDPERQKKAREYAGIRRRLSLGDTALTLALLLILIFTGASHRLAGLLDWPVPASAVVYFLIILLGYGILTFPLSYYRGFILPHRYGISTQKLRGWLADLVKSSLIGLVLGSAAVAVAYWLLLTFPDFWWLLAWILMIVFSIIISIMAPLFLVPLFYKVRPLADSELKSRLEELAKKAGAKINGIFVLDFSARGTTANAALMGMGRTRRIVVSDTLIQQYSVPEIEVVTAHEIGHHLDRDVFRLFVIQTITSFIILRLIDVILKFTAVPLGFSGISDPASLPWLILLFGFFSALASPLTNAYSRHVESQADIYALRLTDDSRSFIRAMTRLVNQNLGVADPPRWEEFLFYDHPSYNKRVGRAREYDQPRDKTP